MKNKVLFVNLGGSPLDRTVWSGIPFSIYNELIQKFDVDVFVIDNKHSILTKIFRKLRNLFIKQNFLDSHNIKDAMKYSRKLQNYLKNKKYDAIFSIGPLQISYLNTDIPIVYFTDAVVSQMINYYWFNVNKKSIHNANLIQKKALNNAAKCVFASKWAMDEAINYYNISKDKCSISHFGSNIEVNKIEKIKHDNINLLFVGKGWERKGANIAVKCVQYLNKTSKNNKFYLNLVGSLSPVDIKDKYIKIYGFINRNNENERKKLDNLRETADIFILPTRAECAGIVFCEASAYSLPIVTFDTGGISDYVINDINGYRIPLDSEHPEIEFANKILEILNSKNKLSKLGKNARKLYENELNWKVFGKKLSQVIIQSIKEGDK